MTGLLLVRGARQLLTLRGPAGPRRGAAMRSLGIIENGAMLIQDGLITNVGPASRVEHLGLARRARVVDAAGRIVMPGFVDSHTHLLFGQPRLNDYEQRIEGRSYGEIAAAGGGILSTVRAVRGTTSRRLTAQGQAALRQMARHGTTTVEAKSGYGLDEGSELKMLRILRALDGEPLELTSTFLGAHAVPPEYEGKADNYIYWLAGHLLPLVASKRLARYADVYCDSGAFALHQAQIYLAAARESGLGLRVHASQFANLGAVQLAVGMGAASVDHLEAAGAAEVHALSGAPTIATLLPGSSFHLGLGRYAPARALIDGGAAVALASDYNPGSSPTCSMQMVLSLACAQMKMTPAEAITAATVNGAHALGVQAQVGTLEAGKQADFLLLDASDYREAPYYFGVNHVAATFKRGEMIYRDKDVSLT
ncbi:MAG: imidazolonepropionase [Candidatus Solibacter usitatus]|nr:imidazolonepropionase [Candidatus Solibacter usitatus]